MKNILIRLVNGGFIIEREDPCRSSDTEETICTTFDEAVTVLARAFGGSEYAPVLIWGIRLKP